MKFYKVSHDHEQDAKIIIANNSYEAAGYYLTEEVTNIKGDSLDRVELLPADSKLELTWAGIPTSRTIEQVLNSQDSNWQSPRTLISLTNAPQNNTTENNNIDIFIVEYREIDTDTDSLVVHAAGSEKKAADWIKQNGIDDDQPDNLQYYYAIFIMPLNHPGHADDGDEFYLAYFDKHGKKVNTIHEIN